MLMAGIYRCDAPGKVLHGNKKICGETDEIRPVFTTRMSEVTKKNRQPVWRCAKHLKGLKIVSAMSGERVKLRR